MKTYEIAIKNNVPVLLWGPPGVGKTAAIQALAKSKNVYLEVLIGSTMDPTDLGRPVVTADNHVTLAPPPWAERLYSALSNGQESWLMLDELTCAPPSVQAALLRVVNERKICDLDISGCRMIAAANPSDQAADGVDLSPAMSNRWCHVDWDINADEWCAGESAGWGDPDSGLSEIRSLVTGWINHNPSALIDVPKFGEEKNSWPSPRAWSNTVQMFRGIDNPARFLRKKEGRHIVASLVGSGAAAEFCAWVSDNDIPSVVDILNGAKVPQRGDRAMLCMSSLVSYGVTHPDSVPEIWPIVSKLRADLAALTTRRFCRALNAANIDYDLTSEALKCHKLAKM